MGAAGDRVDEFCVALQAVVPKDFQDTLGTFAAFVSSFNRVLAHNNYDGAAANSSAAGQAVFNDIEAYLTAKFV